MNEDLERKIDSYIQKMPSLPTSVVKVLEVCNDPRSSPADLNRVISLDPVLTGRVLKLINSAYYSLGQEVTTPVRAIIMLGLNTVKNLALSSAVLDNLKGKGSGGMDMEAFWRHSLGVGVASKLLAKTRGQDPRHLEDYFTAGLLHDIGKIALTAVASEAYAVTVTAAEKKQLPLYKVEETLLGISHCVSGGRIVSAWKLLGPVGDVIVNHHACRAYQGPNQDVLYNVAVANYFAQQSEIGFAGDSHPEIDPVVWEVLKVKPDIVKTLAATVNEEIEKAQIFLKL
ncbi:MAG: HDOD domain-containing protein [Treponema sp.]|jgi:HD-like signal output (HDOD) protein|nr:HDOD domain-containing protein [Treponema sp.]